MKTGGAISTGNCSQMDGRTDENRKYILENTGENVNNQQFFLYPQCFLPYQRHI